MPKRPALTAVLAAALAAVVLAPPHAGAESLAERRARVHERLEAVRDLLGSTRGEGQRLRTEIDLQTARIDDVRERAERLAGEVTALEEDLDAARARLRATREEHARQRRQLRALRAQLIVAQSRLADRLVAVYTGAEPDPVAIVLGADSLGGLLDDAEALGRVARLEGEITADVRTARDRVRAAEERLAALERRREREHDALARRTEERRAAHAALVAEAEHLDALRAERQRSLAHLVVDRREWQQEVAGLAGAEDRLQAAIAAAAAAAAEPSPTPSPSPPPDSGAPSAAGLVWPVRGPVTSPFGMRWGRLHAGIDIGAGTGTPMVAAASGTVTYAGAMSGYGYVIIIQHAGSLSTVYGHASSLSVGTGQTVGRGQAIGLTGCTGHCLGPHLHFETRVNGTPVDPMGYL